MAKLDQISIGGIDYDLIPEVAPIFDTATAYEIGDWVIKDAVLYRFTTAHAAGAWDTNQVEETTVGEEVEKALNKTVDVDKTLTIDGAAADSKTVGDEITTLKADLNTLAASNASKINKPETNVDGVSGQLLRTLGNGQTEWTNFGAPTDEQVDDAVTAWLDEHPESTTTVGDESLTYKKLVIGTLGYVTPEMYGAKGDGLTDDTQAIQDALDAEGLIVLFGNKTYNCEGVVLSNTKTLVFNYTTLSAITDNQPYVLKVTGKVVTHGRIAILGNNKALIGLDLGSTNASGLSSIEYVFIRRCKLWGVYLNDETLLLELGIVHVSMCGFAMEASVERNAQDSFAIDAGSYKSFLEAYMPQTALIVDKTGFKKRNDGTLIPFPNVWRAETFTVDNDDSTTGIITLRAGAQNRIASDYSGQRDVYVLIGGGIGWKFGQGGASHIRLLNCVGNSVGFAPNGTNRNAVDFMYSQGDYIPIGCWGYNIGTSLGTFGVENPKTGIYIYSYSYLNLTINSYCEPLNSGCIATNAELNEFKQIVNVPTTQTRQAIPYVNNVNTTNITINEDTSNELILRNISGTITLNLKYKNTVANSRTEFNPFGVKTLYIGRANGAVHGSDITIKLHANLISSGYVLQGATDNTLVVSCSTDSNFVIRIMKLGNVFMISKEVSNIIT